ncbi:Rqc2 family fibronectin-binding protein [Paenibacillus nasutitermitis]|uniref:Rqc2 homolog RqcH n=1 Tax=Paenibacillus nasutitermitis TaxID=1652958 RepID=A0A916YWP0_9BACL|nr:NFACT RNA binding domain-containing protein [Paenibacillus nasutitermitis]GGD65118.1 hypothetical protein GCM10010911_23610 [Paenibacillus nasutitermitis]
MALDGIVTRAIVHDLQSCIGSRIHKIHQPTDHDLVFQIKGRGMNSKLLLSANPTYPRVQWTEQSFLNPIQAPMFCMLLRKHCESGLIEDIRQVDNERIIHMDIRQRDELGDISLKTIVIEIMGRHSNIILMDAATRIIHDGIHHVTPAISSFRIVMPGAVYAAPPEQGKQDPLTVMSESDFSAVIEAMAVQAQLPADDDMTGKKPAAAPSTMPLDKWLVAAFSGISPLLAKEIVHRSGIDAKLSDEPSVLWPAFDRMMNTFRDHQYEPQIVTSEETGKSAFSVTALTHLSGNAQSYGTVSLCLEAFYGDKAVRDTVKQRVSDLIRFLQNEYNKNEKKIEKLQETLNEAQEADKFRIQGELITTYMHQIQRGDEYIEAVDYYDEDQRTVRIPLDKQLTPSQNAQRYFKKYTKHKNSLTVVGEQMKQAGEEMRYVASLLQQLESATLSDIEEIREELVEQGYLRDRSKRGAKKRKPARPALLCYTSSEGIPIYVGKNNTQNEFLTNKTAAANETWLHTKDIPGSHVVIRASEFNERTLEEAAMLAAHYSQARSSSQIPVDYTLIRHVKKPSGAKPGFVIYDHQKTLFITPDEQRLKALPSQIKV